MAGGGKMMDMYVRGSDIAHFLIAIRLFLSGNSLIHFVTDTYIEINANKRGENID